LDIRIIDPATDEKWNNFLEGQKHSTIFHTSAWSRVILSTYNYKPQYYVLADDAGQYKAAIPYYFVKSIITGNRLVCLPFSDYCWPLGNEEDVIQLLNRAKEYVKTGVSSSMELRGWQNTTDPSRLEMIPRNDYFYYLLDLTPGPDKVNTTLHESVRRGIRQAEKRGVTFRLTNSLDDLEKFYRMNVITRKKLGVLPQPHKFFQNLYTHLISKNLGFVALAECEGKHVAGIVFLTHKDTMYYKFNASLENYLTRRPNHLITWEAIKHACANNFKYMDFGRCMADEEGLRTYKTRWGAKELNLKYYYYPEVKGLSTNTESSTSYRLMRIFARVMPQCVFQATGSVLYKHLG
jgi:CelD/BcsL family acetyltransferase involved in cellulose biosynthesis